MSTRILLSFKMLSYLYFSLILAEETIFELIDNTDCVSTKDIRIQFRIRKEDTSENP